MRWAKEGLETEAQLRFQVLKRHQVSDQAEVALSWDKGPLKPSVRLAFNREKHGEGAVRYAGSVQKTVDSGRWSG